MEEVTEMTWTSDKIKPYSNKYKKGNRYWFPFLFFKIIPLEIQLNNKLIKQKKEAIIASFCI